MLSRGFDPKRQKKVTLTESVSSMQVLLCHTTEAPCNVSLVLLQGVAAFSTRNGGFTPGEMAAGGCRSFHTALTCLHKPPGVLEDRVCACAIREAAQGTLMTFQALLLAAPPLRLPHHGFRPLCDTLVRALEAIQVVYASVSGQPHALMPHLRRLVLCCQSAGLLADATPEALVPLLATRSKRITLQVRAVDALAPHVGRSARLHCGSLGKRKLVMCPPYAQGSPAKACLHRSIVITHCMQSDQA